MFVLLSASLAQAAVGPVDMSDLDFGEVDTVGNTPAVCRSSYICPRLIDEYLLGRPFEMLRKTRRGNPVSKTGLSVEEKALLKFLRETIADRRRRPRAA